MLDPEHETAPKRPGLQNSALLISQSVEKRLSKGDQMSKPWREILPDHFGWEFPTELFSLGFSKRQTSWKSYCWQISAGDLGTLSDDTRSRSESNLPSSQTIRPIGGLWKDLI